MRGKPEKKNTKTTDVTVTCYPKQRMKCFYYVCVLS